MGKCNEKCEVYSRVTGYFRPVSNWNKGKKQEFEDRKVFKVAGTVALLFAAGLCLTGCGTGQTLARGVAEKSLSGSGTVAIQRVGIDDETKTPVLKSTVITGDYASARNGDYALQYRRRKSPSIFNKDAVTEELTINFIGTKEQAAAALDLAKQDARSVTEPTKSGHKPNSDNSPRPMTALDLARKDAEAAKGDNDTGKSATDAKTPENAK